MFKDKESVSCCISGFDWLRTGRHGSRSERSKPRPSPASGFAASGFFQEWQRSEFQCFPNVSVQ